MLGSEPGEAGDYFMKLAGHRYLASVESQLPHFLPSLRDINYYTHQLETVRRVVKLMKGRP